MVACVGVRRQREQEEVGRGARRELASPVMAPRAAGVAALEAGIGGRCERPRHRSGAPRDRRSPRGRGGGAVVGAGHPGRRDGVARPAAGRALDVGAGLRSAGEARRRATT